MTCTVILSFGRKRGFGGPPPENCSIFEALGLQFWRFLKQIRKQIAVIVIEYAAAANQRYLSGSTDENEAKGSKNTKHDPIASSRC